MSNRESLRDLLVVDPGSKAGLVHRDTAASPGAQGRDHVEENMGGVLTRLGALQERLYAAATSGSQQRILLVVQGTDTSGKGGIVQHVCGVMNPEGIHAHAFKAPTAEERQHDFLWRITKELPVAGQVGVFDRSHYEDVGIVRVHGLVPESIWKTRYEAINRWEEQLVASGCRIVKVFMHLSRNEQRDRLLARLGDPDKHWKFNPGDLTERGFWAEYQIAYEAFLTRCSTAEAPWYVVPADHKWYARWAVANLMVETLEEMSPQYPHPEMDLVALRRQIAD